MSQIVLINFCFYCEVLWCWIVCKILFTFCNNFYPRILKIASNCSLQVRKTETRLISIESQSNKVDVVVVVVVAVVRVVLVVVVVVVVVVAVVVVVVVLVVVIFKAPTQRQFNISWV